MAAAGPCTLPEDAESKKGNLKTSLTPQQSEHNFEHHEDDRSMSSRFSDLSNGSDNLFNSWNDDKEPAGSRCSTASRNSIFDKNEKKIPSICRKTSSEVDEYDVCVKTSAFDNSSRSYSSSDTGERSNHGHFGKDLSGFSNHSKESYGLISDYHSLNTLKTPTSGSKKLFIIESSNALTEISLKKRYQISYEGPIAFIESSHLCKFAQCAHGSVVIYRLRLKEKFWKLGIISGIFPLNDPPVVNMFEWTGDLAIFGVPKFVSGKLNISWSEILDHFSFREFHPDEVEILFVNQIRGIPIGNNPICPTTRNEIDGGFQCSSAGPDIFKPDLPNPFQKRYRNCFDFESIKLCDSSEFFSRLFIKPKKKIDNRDRNLLQRIGIANMIV